MNNSIKNKVNTQVYTENNLIYSRRFHYVCFNVIDFHYKQFFFFEKFAINIKGILIIFKYIIFFFHLKW
jgi:hypothetical protein